MTSISFVDLSESTLVTASPTSISFRVCKTNMPERSKDKIAESCPSTNPEHLANPSERPFLSLLGSSKLCFHKKQVPIRGGKSQALLVHLALVEGQPVSRTNLVQWIWPTEKVERAVQSLNNVVSELNKLSRKFVTRTNLICHEQGYYRLNIEDGIGTDLEYFDVWRNAGSHLLEQTAMHMATQDRAERDMIERGLAYCELALALYNGDLCGDSNIRVSIERERLRIAMLGLLTTIASYYYTQGDMEKALIYLYRLLSYEPCDEAAHRQIMRCYMHMGRRTSALRQYHLCLQALGSEFGITPEQATLELVEKIRINSFDLTSPCMDDNLN